jgi:hypothetical protein
MSEQVITVAPHADSTIVLKKEGVYVSLMVECKKVYTIKVKVLTHQLA